MDLNVSNYIAYVLVVVSVFTFYTAVMHLIRMRRVDKRVWQASALSYAPEPTRNKEADGAHFAQWCEKMLSKVWGDSLLVSRLRKQFSNRLLLAGINSPSAITYSLFFHQFIQPLIMVAGVVLTYMVLTQHEIMPLKIRNLIVTVGILYFGFRGTDLIISNARKKREQLLTDSFPEIMDLLLVCIEAGLGLDAALNRVCKELRRMYPEVVAELDRTRLELTMLGDRVVALQNLADRMGTVSYKTLVSALIQTEKFGTSLLDTLRLLSEEQRITRLYNAEQKAARIPVLVTIPLVIFIMPAFLMVILGPPVIKVIENGGFFGESK